MLALQVEDVQVADDFGPHGAVIEIAIAVRTHGRAGAVDFKAVQGDMGLTAIADLQHVDLDPRAVIATRLRLPRDNVLEATGR